MIDAAWWVAGGIGLCVGLLCIVFMLVRMDVLPPLLPYAWLAVGFSLTLLVFSAAVLFLLGSIK